MAGQQIAQYFAKVGLIVENKEFAKVDKALKDVEKQLEKVVGGSAKETKVKKEATAATEKKAKALEKEAKATKDLNKEQEKQSKDIARRIKQQQALLKKADADAVRQANTFAALQKRLNNANPALKALSQKQIAANRAAFFSSARASDIRTGYGAQYRLGSQADAKIRQMVAAQNALLASRATASPISNNKVFEELQLRLASKLRTPRHLTESQINKNRAAFFSNARASDIRTGQGLQYRLGSQADAKIRQMLAGQNALLASRAIGSPISNNKVFEELQLRLASKLRTPRHLTESQINKNRAAFFSNARVIETKTGQGLQYRLGDRVAKIQQATQRQQEQAAVSNQRQARRVSDTVDKGLRDLERELQRAFSPVQNATARRNIRRAAEGLNTPPRQGGGGGTSGGGSSAGGRGGRSSASYSRANYLHAGGSAGAIARYGLQSLPFVGGVYGMGQLNRSNQELISGQLTTQAVLAAKGYSTREGIQANQWLMTLADDVGFNYMQALPDYNQFLSNALGAGLGVGQSQEIFQGFSEYQTAMGVTPARRKLVQNALSQMLGKGVLSMEEVKISLAA